MIKISISQLHTEHGTKKAAKIKRIFIFIRFICMRVCVNVCVSISVYIKNKSPNAFRSRESNVLCRHSNKLYIQADYLFCFFFLLLYSVDRENLLEPTLNWVSLIRRFTYICLYKLYGYCSLMSLYRKWLWKIEICLWTIW